MSTLVSYDFELAFANASCKPRVEKAEYHDRRFHLVETSPNFWTIQENETLVHISDDHQTSYRWWGSPPTGWEILEQVTQYVIKLADIPRKALNQQHQEVVQGFFEQLVNRNTAGLLRYYHPAVQYKNPWLELQRAFHRGELGIYELECKPYLLSDNQRFQPWAISFPLETNAILIIKSNAMLAFTVTFE